MWPLYEWSGIVSAPETVYSKKGELKMFENYDDILTVEEACEALKIGYNAIYELLNTGKLKGYRNGRVWRIPKMALVEYIQSSSKLK